MLPETRVVELKPALSVSPAKSTPDPTKLTQTASQPLDVDAAAQPPPHRVVSQHANAWYFHDARTVSRFFSANKYTCFVQEGHEHYATESLSALERRLAPLGFIRTHRADLINLSHIRCIKRVRHAFEITLKDGQCVTASRRLVHALRSKLGF